MLNAVEREVKLSFQFNDLSPKLGKVRDCTMLILERIGSGGGIEVYRN